MEKINSVIIKLGLVSFFADVASEMLYPVTPIFLTSVLGASMVSVGLIEGIAESIASLLKTYSGNWSDSLKKRKPFIIIGYLLGAISKPLIGMSNSWIGVLTSRALDRTGKGIRSAPRDALIADVVDEGSRGIAFGWHRAMDSLGATVGPLVAILLLSVFFVDLRSLYFWAIIPGLLSVLILFTLNEKTTVEKRIPIRWINPFCSWNELNSDFKKYLFGWSAFTIANSSDVFLIMKAKSSGLSTQMTILLYCAYNLTYALSSPFLGKLSDHNNRRKLLIAGLGIFSLVYFGFSLAFSPWHFWLLFLSYGLYMGATDGVGKALIVDLSPKNLRGTALGITGTITGFTTIFASTFAGFLWDRFGPRYVFYYGAVGALGSIFILSLTSSSPRKSQPTL